MAQYDPENPADPNWPEKALPKYPVICEAIPGGAYSFTTQEYVAGKKVSVYANSHDGCIFLGWYDATTSGLLTEKNTYTFTMPEEAVKLYALFTYDPNSPGDPLLINKYWLKIKAEPAVGASFNFTQKKVEEGSTQNISAYINNGFKFIKWKNQFDEDCGTSKNLPYLMPSKDIVLTAVLEYAPEEPVDPGTNYWDDASGNLIMDYYNTGNLYSAMIKMVGSGNQTKVTHLQLDGTMNSNDFGFTNYFTKITHLDMSRVNGITEIPSYTWQDNTDLQVIELPASISLIRNYALSGCTMLRQLHCYAAAPPKVEKYAMKDLPADLVVYVPESSVDLYKAADVWKDFDILPLQSKLCNLTVTLPEECKDGRYKNQILEIHNIKTGQRQRYIVTDRLAYTFNNLVLNTTWKAYVKNSFGDIIGETSPVVLDKEEVTLALSGLKKLQTLFVDVKDKDGNSITPKEIRWYDSAGNLHVSDSLENQVPGCKVSLDIILPSDLLTIYMAPNQSIVTVAESANGQSTVTVQVQSYPVYTLKGTVIDDISGMPISGVTVTASQTISGAAFTKSIVTDAKGRYALAVPVSTTVEVAYSEEGHLTHKSTFEPADLAAKANAQNEVALANVIMRPLQGIIADVDASFLSPVAEGGSPQPSSFLYFKKVSYTLKNKSTGKDITEFSVQHPKIIILNGAKEGDEIEATMHYTDSPVVFDDVVAQGVVNANGHISLDFAAVSRGNLFARFLVTDNKQVQGALYDATGSLVEKQIYRTKWEEVISKYFGQTMVNNNIPNYVYFSNLEDGNYTLVTMGNSSFLPIPNSLSTFASLGLMADVDYVATPITIQKGVFKEIRNVIVPLLEESKFYYTGSNTSFAINKPNTVAGNYLTLNGKVDFLDKYKEHVSDVRMYVELPYNCKMVEGSAILNKQLTVYENAYSKESDTYNVTIPLGENFTNRAKFSIVPSVHGNYTVSAYVKFKLDGEEKVQPIGNATYTVNDITIWAPAMISKPDLFVDGNAPSMAHVQVFDALNGDRLLAETKALADGYWSVDTKLPGAHNLDMYEIYARITTQDGTVITSPVRPVEYNTGHIQGKTVEMKYWNGTIGVNRTIDVTWDLERYKTSAKSYMFLPNTEFSFIADLTNNDPEKVESCVIRVFTNNHEWIELPAYYVKNLDRWCSHSKFTTQTMPIGVRVEVVTNLSEAAAIQELQESHAKYEEVPNVIEDVATYVPDPIQPSEPEEEPQEYPLDQIMADQAALEQVMLSDNPVNLTENEDIEFEVDDEQYEAEEVEDWFDDDYDSLIKINEIEAEEDENYDEDDEDDEDQPTDPAVPTESQTKPSLNYYANETETEMAIVDEINNEAYYIHEKDSNSPGGSNVKGQKRVRMAAELVDKIDARIATFEKLLRKVNDKYTTLREKNLAFQQILSSAVKAAQSLYDYYTTQMELAAGDPVQYATLEAQRNSVASIHNSLLTQLNASNASLKVINDNFTLLRHLGSVVGYGHDACDDLNSWQAFIDGILPCNGLDDPQARGLWDICMTDMNKLGESYLKSIYFYQVDLALLEANIPDDLVNPVTLNLASIALGTYMHTHVNKLYFGTKVQSRNLLRRAKRDRNRLINCNYAKLEEMDNIYDPSLPYPLIEPIIDPSGYVYEGVSSNRLQGVTATALWKKTYEDEYGDLHEDIIVWDASQYSQENPLLTDENGQYQWDVPQGLWQVKLEKEGYQTTFSEWLPVPPPQLDVNLAMVQSSRPEVVKARAFETDGQGTSNVEIVFDKYMKPELMTAENVYLKAIKGEEEILLTNLTFSYPDQEESFEGSEVKYAKTVDLSTNGVDLGLYDEVYVLVSANVQSYAGITMQEAYQQKLDIEKRVESLVAPTELNVAFGGQTTVQIGALPVEAASGKQVRVTVASTLTASLPEQNETMVLTLDENGMAQVELSGVLFGTTALRVEMLNEAITATVQVYVVDSALLAKVKVPVSSRLSGTQVFSGQTVSLSCETEGATIYYTTDGTCPCESATRIKYTTPITIQDAMTLKAMAIGYTGEESEVVEYVYTIRQSQVTVDLAKGWNWVSHDLAAPLQVSELASVALRVRTQTQEGVFDAINGYVGNLSTVAGHEAMKIEAAAAGQKAFTGEQFNPGKNIIDMQAGWNWLGYPLSQAMTVSDALAYMDVEDGDCLTNLEDGFSVYHDGNWKGNLQTMDPGHGYLYKAQSAKSFIYATTSSVANAKALTNGYATKAMPWSVDKHRYPNLMPVVAELGYHDQSVSDSTYYVAAFYGEECRGMGTFENGILYLSVYGDEPCELSFVAINSESQARYPLDEKILFQADLVGSLDAPYHFNLDCEAVGIHSVAANSHKGIYNLQGVRVSSASRPGIYIINDAKTNSGRKQYVR